MSLEERLSADIAAAMKAREATKLATFRMLKTALTNKSIEKGRALEPAEELQVVASLVKQRRDSIDQYTKGGRQDLADIEAAEISVIESYLPEQLSDTEIERLINDAIAESGAGSIRDMGKVMGIVKAKAAGRADMGAVGAAVKARLG